MSSETVLHGRIHIEPDLQDVPEVAPLCDSAGVTRPPVSVDGCRLFCEVQGEGTPIVLLHGGPGGTHHCFHHSFGRAAAFARVIFYDQRGCGQSDYVPGETGYTIAQAVADLDSIRQSLGVDTWIVLGYSYGGLLAQCYAVEHPDRVTGLVLVGSSIPADVKLARTRQYDYISFEERYRFREIQRLEDVSPIQKLYNVHLNGDWKRQNFYRPTPERLAHTARYEWKHDADFNPVMSREMRKIDLRGAFEECPVPTLIAEGKWDLTWNVDKPEKLHAVHPKARIELFERSGHGPFDDEPERFFDLLRELVGQADTVDPADLGRWRVQLEQWRKRRQASPEYVIKTAGYGRHASRKLAEAYDPAWLDAITSSRLLARIGFALYDVERYEEALKAFWSSESAADEDLVGRSIALIWQGHVLDLLERRDDALSTYQKAADLDVGTTIQHAQFRLEYIPAHYARQRLQEPFVRIENQEA